jgi:hypothetical protein
MSILFEANANFVVVGPAFDTRNRYLRVQATSGNYAIPSGPTMAAAVQVAGLRNAFGGSVPPSINWTYKCGAYTMAKRSGGGSVVPVTAPTVVNSVVGVDT